MVSSLKQIPNLEGQTLNFKKYSRLVHIAKSVLPTPSFLFCWWQAPQFLSRADFAKCLHLPLEAISCCWQLYLSEVHAPRSPLSISIQGAVFSGSDLWEIFPLASQASFETFVKAVLPYNLHPACLETQIRSATGSWCQACLNHGFSGDLLDYLYNSLGTKPLAHGLKA